MKAQELIKELGQRLNLPALKLNENNVCRIIFDIYAVDFETLTDNDVLYLIAELGTIPAENSEACFRRLLEANRYGMETKNATLSIDPDRSAVILHKFLDISAMDYSSFEPHLEDFLERYKYWHEFYNIEPEVETSQENNIGIKV